MKKEEAEVVEADKRREKKTQVKTFVTVLHSRAPSRQSPPMSLLTLCPTLPPISKLFNSAVDPGGSASYLIPN